MTALPALLTEAEAAERIGVAPRTLRELRSKGKIRYVRPSPRKVFYRADDLAEYLPKQMRYQAALLPDWRNPVGFRAIRRKL